MEPKIALVTGCSSGIGEACVIQLVKEGMTVVGVARRLDRLESLAEILQKEVGEFHYRQVDFRVESEIIELYQFIKKKFGGLDFVVNNAGTGCKSSLIDGNTKDWEGIFQINTIAVAISTREAIRLMKSTKTEGYIIQMNSISGHDVPAATGATTNIYPATKHALSAMNKVVRYELRAAEIKIRITSISPGIVNTELRNFSGSLDQSEITVELTSKDIAEVVAFLFTRPKHVEVTEIIIKPLGSAF